MIPPDEHFDRGGSMPPGWNRPDRTPPPSWLTAFAGAVIVACLSALVVAATVAAVRWML
jgi:hypothetical protein